MIRRADEVDARVEAAWPITGEPRPREVHIHVAGATRPVDLDRSLVMELAEQIRRRRTRRHVERADELLTILARRPVDALRVFVCPDPDVAERFRRPSGIARALRAREQP